MLNLKIREFIKLGETYIFYNLISLVNNITTFLSKSFALEIKILAEDLVVDIDYFYLLQTLFIFIIII